MKVLFDRKAVIPTSLIALGLLAMLSSPLGFTPPAILIMVAVLIAIIIVSMLRQKPSPTVAEVLHQTGTRRKTESV